MKCFLKALLQQSYEAVILHCNCAKSLTVLNPISEGRLMQTFNNLRMEIEVLRVFVKGRETKCYPTIFDVPIILVLSYYVASCLGSALENLLCCPTAMRFIVESCSILTALRSPSSTSAGVNCFNHCFKNIFYGCWIWKLLLLLV